MARRRFRGTAIFRLAFATAIWLVIAIASRADDWPQWRGPNRDGVWSETGILKSFPASGLKFRWRVSVGPGWSSPVVAKGRVYVTDSELKMPDGKERVHCFDEATGKLLWTYPYEVKYPDFAFRNRRGPTATPTVHKGKLYTIGNTGNVFCFDALDGKVLWKKNLDRDYKLPDFSFAHPSSPLVEGDLLVLFIGSVPGAEASSVIAFDLDSGKEVWRALNENLTNSSLIALTAGGKRQVIVWTQESVTSLDPATGKTYWRNPMNTNAASAVATPVIQRNLLLVSGLMLELDAKKPDASILWPDSKAVDRRVLSRTSTPLVRGDHLFSAKSSGALACLATSTGKKVWETDKVTDMVSGASIHLTLNGETVFLFTDKGELILADLSAKGYNEISRTRLLQPTTLEAGRKFVWPPPAYANHHVYARNDEELICASLAADE
jgi:outer membrane protein assembly factor BamB